MIYAKDYIDTSASIYGKMTELATQHNAINFTQGAPEFDTPNWLIDKVDFYMKQGKNQYSPIYGALQLRNAIANKQKICYDVDIGVENIAITSGAIEGLFALISTYVNKDDEVIFFDPAFDAYIGITKFNQGKCIRLNLLEDGRINLKAIANSITPKTKIIILNSPHNPMGTVISKDEYQELAKIIHNKDILVIADEVYEHIYAGNSFVSAIQIPELHKQLVVIQSLGKTYNTTGWRVGVIIAPHEIIRHVLAIKQFMSFSASHPVQLALADVIHEYPEYYQNLPKLYQQQNKLLRKYLHNSRFKLLEWHGSSFQILDYSAISDENDMELCMRLIKDYGVGLIPLSSLSESPSKSLLRLCFAKKDTSIIEGAHRLCQI